MAVRCGSAGRVVYRTGEDPAPPTFRHHISSYCFMCARWFYGQRIQVCARCKAPIHQWVGDSNLHFME